MKSRKRSVGKRGRAGLTIAIVVAVATSVISMATAAPAATNLPSAPRSPVAGPTNGGARAALDRAPLRRFGDLGLRHHAVPRRRGRRLAGLPLEGHDPGVPGLEERHDVHVPGRGPLGRGHGSPIGADVRDRRGHADGPDCGQGACGIGIGVAHLVRARQEQRRGRQGLRRRHDLEESGHQAADAQPGGDARDRQRSQERRWLPVHAAGEECAWDRARVEALEHDHPETADRGATARRGLLHTTAAGRGAAVERGVRGAGAPVVVGAARRQRHREPHRSEAAGEAREHVPLHRDLADQRPAPHQRRLHRNHRRDHAVGGLQVGLVRQRRARRRP